MSKTKSKKLAQEAWDCWKVRELLKKEREKMAKALKNIKSYRLGINIFNNKEMIKKSELIKALDNYLKIK